MSRNPSQLFLLADHIKLSLLERQRAISLNLPQNSQDGQISRSLDSLHTGIEQLEAQLAQSDDPLNSSEEDAALRDQIDRLRRQFADLNHQFRGDESGGETLRTPNDSSLAGDFAAAQARGGKAVRFRDAPDAADEANRAALFPSTYRDDPDDAGPPDQTDLSNQQIHDYHRQVLADQDEQLDRLGLSIGRQRDLSIQIGDELDSQAVMLDEVDERVDRHQGQLDRASGRLGRIARKARENWSMTTIVVLIVILVLLIIITKR